MDGRWRNSRLHPTKRAPSRCPHGSLLNDRTDNCNKCKSYDGGAFTTKEILQKWSQSFGLPIHNPATTKSGKNREKTIEELCAQIGDYVADNGGELHDLLADAGFGSINTKKTIENKEREREKKALVAEAKVAASTLDEDKLLEIAQKMAAIKMAEKAEATSTVVARAPSATPNFATYFSKGKEEATAADLEEMRRQRARVLETGEGSKRRVEETVSVTETVASKYINGLVLNIMSDASVQVILDGKVVATYPNYVRFLEVPQAGFVIALRGGEYIYVGFIENSNQPIGIGIYPFQARPGDASPIDSAKPKAVFSKQTSYAVSFGRAMSVAQFNAYMATPVDERPSVFESLSTQFPNVERTVRVLRK